MLIQSEQNLFLTQQVHAINFDSYDGNNTSSTSNTAQDQKNTTNIYNHTSRLRTQLLSSAAVIHIKAYCHPNLHGQRIREYL